MNHNEFNWDDTSRALQVSNDDRNTLDAYIRFQQSAPCWHEDCRRPFSAAKDLNQTTHDGLHYFSTRT